MNTPPTPPNYLVIYWLALEKTGKHAQASQAIEEAKAKYEQELKAYLAKVAK